MALDVLLAAFLEDVETFARHQAIWEQARVQAPDFPEDVVEQVVSDHRDRALDALARVMNALPAVEGVRGELRARIRALDQERVDVENALDALELQHSIGSLDPRGPPEEGERLRRRFDALSDEMADLADEARQIDRVLARWQDVGAEQAVTV